MVASSRIVFGYLIPVLSGFLRGQDRRAAAKFLLLSGGGFLLVNAVFYRWNPAEYFPLHRFYGSYTCELTTPLYTVVAGLMVAAVCVLAAKRVEDSASSWMFNLWLTLIVPMFVAALGDLLHQGSLARWEGANYLALTLPVCAAWATMTTAMTDLHAAE
jgi:hypothetical protein